MRLGTTTFGPVVILLPLKLKSTDCGRREKRGHAKYVFGDGGGIMIGDHRNGPGAFWLGLSY
jgi:hypothetical protein